MKKPFWDVEENIGFVKIEAYGYHAHNFQY